MLSLRRQRKGIEGGREGRREGGRGEIVEIQPRMHTHTLFDNGVSSDLNLEWKGKIERKASQLCHGSDTESGDEMAER